MRSSPSGGRSSLFPELCHGCGACTLLCPEHAITEVPRAIGVLEAGTSGVGGAIGFAQGRLNVGEAKAPPVVEAVAALADVPTGEVTIIDAPPGTSCPVIAAVRGADLVLLVAEPTPFGVHDLRLAVEMVEALGQRAALVINRSDSHDEEVEALARAAWPRDPGAHPRRPPHRRGVRARRAAGHGGARALPHLLRPVEGNRVMIEVAVVSGKGGTGKTSLTASLRGARRAAGRRRLRRRRGRPAPRAAADGRDDRGVQRSLAAGDRGGGLHALRALSRGVPVRRALVGARRGRWGGRRRV